MVEGLPVEGVIAVVAFVASLVVLGVIHGVSDAIRKADASRREANEMLSQLSKVVESGRSSRTTGLSAPEVDPSSQRPVRRKRVKRYGAGFGSEGQAKPIYGPRKAKS